MSTRLIFRLTAPTMALSGLLLAVGIGTAWYVHKLQQETSDLVARNVAAVNSAGDLVSEAREVQSRLREYVDTEDPSHLEFVAQLQKTVEKSLADAERMADEPRQQELIAEVRLGFERFFEELNVVKANGDLQVRDLLHRSVGKGIVPPAHSFLTVSQKQVAQITQHNLLVARRVGLGLLLLGTCGSVAGLVAGFGIARTISRSLIQLSVPIHDAAGKLNEVVGPINLAASGGIEGLEQALHNVADRVGTVVDKLQQSQREVLRAEQLAAVGQMAAGLAHELRNPLTSMKILVQSAVERGPAGQVSGRDLSVLDEEIRRQERSIQSFLDFARPPKLETRTFDARALARQTLDLVRRRAQRQDVCLESHLPDSPALIDGDSEQVRQVLLNLLINALDALPGGGTVTVALALDAPSGCRGWLEIRVADNGSGLPAELGERIFEPFVSARETGMGLGLSISKRIVESHGGRISAVNQPAGGAVFTVRLPLARSP